MHPTFEFTFGEAYFVAMHRRARDSLRGRRGFVALKIVLGSLLAVVLGLCALVRPSVGALVFVLILVTMLVLLVFAADLGEWLAGRNVRRSIYRDELVRVTVSPSGCSIVGAMSGRSDLPWSSFTHAMRVRDGFLLFRGPMCNWLPIEALTRGTADEADALIRQNIADYRST